MRSGLMVSMAAKAADDRRGPAAAMRDGEGVWAVASNATTNRDRNGLLRMLKSGSCVRTQRVGVREPPNCKGERRFSGCDWQSGNHFVPLTAGSVLGTSTCAV